MDLAATGAFSLRLLVGGVAVLLVGGTVSSAVRTFVLPRASQVRLSKLVFAAVHAPYRWLASKQDDHRGVDRVMATFAPVALLLLPVVWMVIVFASYAGIFWALEPDVSATKAIELSGSSLLTLGTTPPSGLASHLAGYTEAGLGLAMLALLITYLPSMYSAFQRREALVTALEVRAGTPPAATTMLIRVNRIGWLDRLDTHWQDWSRWFVEVQESHTSLFALAFFRSPQPDLSWVTAAGTVLDAAALTASTLVTEQGPGDANLCIRAGFLCLRAIADSFDIEHDEEPSPTDPISIDRREFDAVCAELAAAGVVLRPDLDQAWRDFAGWRVNYDRVLLALASLTNAPPAQWSSDRSIVVRGRIMARRRR